MKDGNLFLFLFSTQYSCLNVDLPILKFTVSWHSFPYQYPFRLKQQLGLKEDLPTLLMMGGGYGMIEICGILKRIKQTIQVVVICGKNKKRRYHGGFYLTKTCCLGQGVCA